MDKSKVIAAYRRGFISMQECKQILGLSTMQLLGMLDTEDHRGSYVLREIVTTMRQSVNS